MICTHILNRDPAVVRSPAAKKGLFDPDLDPEGRYARELAQAITNVLVRA